MQRETQWSIAFTAEFETPLNEYQITLTAPGFQESFNLCELVGIRQGFQVIVHGIEIFCGNKLLELLFVGIRATRFRARLSVPGLEFG